MILLDAISQALGLTPRSAPTPQPTPQIEKPAPQSKPSQPEKMTELPLPHLIPAMIQAHEAALPQYQETMDAFYASPESRLGLKNQEVCSGAKKAWEEAVRKPLLDELRRHPDAEAEIRKYLESFGRSIEEEEFYDLYRRLICALAPSSFPGPGHVPLSSLTQLHHQLLSAQQHALRRHWKGCVLLDGCGPYSYGRSYYYDEELQFFFCLCPDDNYYHWGTHEYFSTDKNRVQNHCEQDLSQLPVASQVPPYFTRFRDSYEQLPEIVLRL